MFFRILSILAPVLLLSPAIDNRISAQTGPQFESIEQQVFSLVNRQRQAQKLLPLNKKESISAQCRQHSVNMAKGIVTAGHEGIEERIQSIRPLVKVLTYSENVAVSRGYKDPALDAVEGWMKSPKHCKALLGDYDLTGIGVAMSADSTFYITQIYIKSR